MTLPAVPDRALPARIEQVKAWLAETENVEAISKMVDLAEAAKRYAASDEAQQYAAEVKLRAARRGGEILAYTVKHEGGRPTGNRETLSQLLGRRDDDARQLSSLWQKLAHISDEGFERYLRKTRGDGADITMAGALKLVRSNGTAKGTSSAPAKPAREIPTGTYSAIVADPPWQYDNRATRGAAEDHYATMTLDELYQLDVEKRAARDAHLYLWTTNGFLREAFTLMENWGFEYKTLLTWVKPQMGMGNYFRSSTEHVLFGLRGSLPTNVNDRMNWFEAPRGKHSSKPDMFYDLVEAASPGPYLEMFARSRRFGWDFWGDEA